MPDPFLCFLLLVILFCTTTLISLLFKKIFTRGAEREEGDKIYYIEKYRYPKKITRRRNAKIALKGALLTPAEFHREKTDDKPM